MEELTTTPPFDFEVYAVLENTDPIVVLSLNNFLQMTNSIMELNREVKDDDVMELVAFIQTKLSQGPDLGMMFKNKPIKDSLTEILSYAKGE